MLTVKPLFKELPSYGNQFESSSPNIYRKDLTDVDFYSSGSKFKGAYVGNSILTRATLPNIDYLKGVFFDAIPYLNI